MLIEWKSGRTPGRFGWFSFDKFLAIGMVVLILAFIVAVGRNASAADVPLLKQGRLVVTEDLKQPPLDAFQMTECGATVRFMFILQDGTPVFLVGPDQDGVDADAVVKWGGTATASKGTIELPCLGGQSQDTDLHYL